MKKVLVNIKASENNLGSQWKESSISKIKDMLPTNELNITNVLVNKKFNNLFLVQVGDSLYIAMYCLYFNIGVNKIPNRFLGYGDVPQKAIDDLINVSKYVSNELKSVRI